MKHEKKALRASDIDEQREAIIEAVHVRSSQTIEEPESRLEATGERTAQTS